ncbi:hypothetical protein Acr_00g0049950 [Actinidia rufa]|uniref:Uncharacterized protein n=1 Tax=Actinidia rufa TaxID=165716 RepID=A0A7J0DMB0_9ERIC|nr:hypothetical protein Acr_00g0049950 [Actinidia rufa]
MEVTTSMIMECLFNEEARRREWIRTDQKESQPLSQKEAGKRPRSWKTHHKVLEKDGGVTIEGRTVRCLPLAAEIERCSLHSQHARGRIWMQTTRLAGVVGREHPHGRRSGGILRVSENKENTVEKKTGGLTELRGVSKDGGTISTMGPVVLASKWNKEATVNEVRKASAGTWRIRSVTRATWDLRICTEVWPAHDDEPVQDCPLEKLRRRNQSRF